MKGLGAKPELKNPECGLGSGDETDPFIYYINGFEAKTVLTNFFSEKKKRKNVFMGIETLPFFSNDLKLMNKVKFDLCGLLLLFFFFALRVCTIHFHLCRAREW